MDRAIEITKSNVELIQQIQLDDMFAQNGRDAIGQLKSSQAWEAILDRDFGPDWRKVCPEETKLYVSFFCWRYKGRHVSHDHYKKVNQTMMCLAHKPDTVLEIGAGFGQVGRLLMLSPNRPKKYVVIDILKSLIFSYAFLAETLPNLTILLAGSEEDFWVPCDVLLIPSELAEAYADAKPSVDVILNSSSFGEMPTDVSTFYINLLQEQIRPKHAIFLNRLCNTYDPRTEKYRENEAGWYWALDGHWKINRWELEPDFTRIPYVEIAHQREVLILADYTEELQPVPKIPDWIYSQKWAHEFKPQPARRYMNQLGFDNEVLAILFEAVRRDRSAENLLLILMYLTCIRKHMPFEETPFLLSEHNKAQAHSKGNVSQSVETVAPSS